MEDLIGLIAFIIFAAVNILAQSAKKKRNQQTGSDSSPDGMPEKKPSTLEEFFENLAEKLDPKEPELPEWPEGYEKPDYMQEMKEFNEAQQAEPAPPPVPMEPVHIVEDTDEDILPKIGATSLKTAIKSVPALAAGSLNMRFVASPMLKSQTAGNGYRISLKDKSELKKAIIANIIFSPPRAYDSTIENTIIT
jgi:hypothetical protein